MLETTLSPKITLKCHNIMDKVQTDRVQTVHKTTIYI